MQIIHIILGKANPNRMNGVNKVVWQLATHQFKTGLNVQVWGITKTPEVQDFETQFPLKLFKANRFSAPIGLEKEILECEASDTIFHFHGGFILDFFFIALLLIKHQLKYVLTPHGAYNTVAMQRSWFRKQLYFFLFEKKLVTNASFIQAVGKSEIDGLNQKIKGANQLLIPNGYISDYNHEPVNTPENVFIIAYCGRLDVHTKGIDLMLASMALLKNTTQSKLPFELWLIGDGSDRKWITKEIVKRDLGSVVHLKGAQYGNAKIKLLKQAHLFLHPSRNEGMPTGVQEAASLGLPLIVSEETNLGKYVNDFNAGWVLPENNSVNQVIAISKAMQLQATGKLSEKKILAAKMVATEFDWAPIAMKLQEGYEAVFSNELTKK